MGSAKGRDEVLALGFPAHHSRLRRRSRPCVRNLVSTALDTAWGTFVTPPGRVRVAESEHRLVANAHTYPYLLPNSGADEQKKVSVLAAARDDAAARGKEYGRATWLMLLGLAGIGLTAIAEVVARMVG